MHMNYTEICTCAYEYKQLSFRRDVKIIVEIIFPEINKQ